MATVALLSNPYSTGNRSMLPRVRNFCARHPDIFHYEVEEVSQIARALESIAAVEPKVIVINGGDGTVQTALTELYQGTYFPDGPPPVAVLPNGKTNLIALDLGAQGNPLVALEKIVEIAKTDIEAHVVRRELIALSDDNGKRPVLGMFLGGAGLAECILYCRHKIYPLGLPNGVAHLVAGIVSFFVYVLGLHAKFLPRRSPPMRISLVRDNELQGSFSVLIVTTLEKLLMGQKTGAHDPLGKLKFIAVDQSPRPMFRAAWAALRGRLDSPNIAGVHVQKGDLIRIEGTRSPVILDGEMFETDEGHPIVLRSTTPVPFLRLAA